MHTDFISNIFRCDAQICYDLRTFACKLVLPYTQPMFHLTAVEKRLMPPKKIRNAQTSDENNVFSIAAGCVAEKLFFKLDAQNFVMEILRVINFSTKHKK